MFKLNSDLETDVEFNGRTYEVDMSFDNILDVFDTLEDMANSPTHALYTALELLVGEIGHLAIEELPELFMAIRDKYLGEDNVEAITYDLNGDPMPLPNTAKNSGTVIDMTLDAEYIWTSFIQAYRMDLRKEYGKLDWREFQALLRDLPTDTKMKQIIEIRTWEPSKGDSAKERERMRELQKYYGLPNDRKED
jgi:hypothetical protein